MLALALASFFFFLFLDWGLRYYCVMTYLYIYITSFEPFARGIPHHTEKRTFEAFFFPI